MSPHLLVLDSGVKVTPPPHLDFFKLQRKLTTAVHYNCSMTFYDTYNIEEMCTVKHKTSNIHL